MDLSEPPAWSKTKMNKLGKALLSGGDVPAGCPTYDDVMLWHHELAAEVARIIRGTSWAEYAPTLRNLEIRVSSRGKTVDTLVQKLERSGIGLEAIQDLAGVRVDGRFTLTQQTQIADAMAEVFSVDERGKRDLRENPHSGYRAYHLWVRCPAGRVEIQIRTEGQSEWANTYERLGDILGRGIRYDEPADSEFAQSEEAKEVVQTAVEQMHKVSHTLQVFESYLDFAESTAHMGPDYFDSLLGKSSDPNADHELYRIRQNVATAQRNRDQMTRAYQEYIDVMRENRRMLDNLEVV
ncbi:GTP pyrophosphokinase family protein [Rhodococcus sp. NPDC056743]|uniref:GTP pyrophosphokinase family protein n=1 Tax=Rhodococcus sp. NPDC056743 TaxID=3345934 RepID=UPI00366C958C